MKRTRKWVGVGTASISSDRNHLTRRRPTVTFKPNVDLKYRGNSMGELDNFTEGEGSRLSVGNRSTNERTYMVMQLTENTSPRECSSSHPRASECPALRGANVVRSSQTVQSVAT